MRILLLQVGSSITSTPLPVWPFRLGTRHVGVGTCGSRFGSTGFVAASKAPCLPIFRMRLPFRKMGPYQLRTSHIKMPPIQGFGYRKIYRTWPPNTVNRVCFPAECPVTQPFDQLFPVLFVCLFFPLFLPLSFLKGLGYRKATPGTDRLSESSCGLPLTNNSREKQGISWWSSFWCSL